MNAVKNPILRKVMQLLDEPDNMSHLPHVLQTAGQPVITNLDMERDLPTLFEWVNQPYAIPYWQMNGPFPELQQSCEEWMLNPATHSLVVLLNQKLVCQLDIYETVNDAVGKFYPAEAGDIGIHLLMAPGVPPEPLFTKKILFLLVSLLFRAPLVDRVVCEPDVRNEPACRLLERLGFQLDSKLEMGHKTANLYILPRKCFVEKAFFEY